MTLTTTVLHGDALTLLREQPDGSVDAVVTDPPYNLSVSRQRDLHCIRRVLKDVHLPHHQDRDLKASESSHLSIPPFLGSTLGGMDGSVRVDTRVGVPERAVDFQGAPVFQPEVQRCNESSSVTADGDLPPVSVTQLIKNPGNYILRPADCRNSTFCDGTCSCFTELGQGLFAMEVALSRPTGGHPSGDCVSTGGRGGANVGFVDYSRSEAESASAVHTGAGAVVNAVLRIDLRRREGQLFPARSAGSAHSVLHLISAELVGTDSGACRLPSMSKSIQVSLVAGSTNRAFTLHIPAHLFDLSPGESKGFMGQTWDGWGSPASYQRWCAEWARECFRVLKPGGHLLAFGSARTYHRLTCGIEDAGFDIRDSISWLYGSGMPKSHDIGKALTKSSHPDADHWQGWGTGLKPAAEFIAVARKPFAGTVAANVTEHGTGALNIDACRTPAPEAPEQPYISNGAQSRYTGVLNGGKTSEPESRSTSASNRGRWPANVLLDEETAAEVDQQSGITTSSNDANRFNGLNKFTGSTYATDEYSLNMTSGEAVVYGDTGGASRFFPVFKYQAKAPTRERPEVHGIKHPTVKPLTLIRWLCRLVTPPAGTVLDPFAGSGTTGEAALLEGFNTILIEREQQYLPLIAERIRRATP